MSEYKAAAKRAIGSVTLTVTVKATRISEKGTFSGFTVESVKGPNKTFKAVSPPQSGGAIYLQVSSLDGITMLGEETGQQEKAKTKLF